MFWHVDIPRACQMSPELLLMVSPLSTNGRQSTTKHAMVAVDTTKLLLLPSIVAVCPPLYLVSSKRVDTFNDTSVNALGCSYLSPPPTHRSFVSCVAASCSPAGGCTVTVCFVEPNKNIYYTGLVKAFQTLDRAIFFNQKPLYVFDEPGAARVLCLRVGGRAISLHHEENPAKVQEDNEDGGAPASAAAGDADAKRAEAGVQINKLNKKRKCRSTAALGR